MYFSIKCSISPNDFNNQRFVILGRILMLFAWKLFSLGSFGHLDMLPGQGISCKIK